MKLKEFIIKSAINLIPKKSLRKKLREKYLPAKNAQAPLLNEKPHIISQYYGKIYIPYYPCGRFNEDELEIYNKDGQKMETWFIRDFSSCHCPYAETSKYFIFDRFNIGLKTHFYTHSAILETMGKPDYKYALFLESEYIIPDDYKIFETHKGIEKDFDQVFTFSEKLLNTLDNAKFFPACANVWYSKEVREGQKDPATLKDTLFEEKNKNLSMVCSNKILTDMHKIRHNFADNALKTGKIDLYGTKEGARPLKFKSTSLTNYRFQIVIENGVAPYYFTEKILDCFISMTIPVYLGATKIDEFFNLDGIIKINKDTDINSILDKCTELEYQRRLDAVKDNYQRALKYLNINDMLYKTVKGK